MELEKFGVLENKVRKLVEDYSHIVEKNKKLEDELKTKKKETGNLTEKRAAAVKMVKKLIKVLDELNLPSG